MEPPNSRRDRSMLCSPHVRCQLVSLGHNFTQSYPDRFPSAQRPSACAGGQRSCAGSADAARVWSMPRRIIPASWGRRHRTRGRDGRRSCRPHPYSSFSQSNSDALSESCLASLTTISGDRFGDCDSKIAAAIKHPTFCAVSVSTCSGILPSIGCGQGISLPGVGKEKLRQADRARWRGVMRDCCAGDLLGRPRQAGSVASQAFDHVCRRLSITSHHIRL